MRGILYGITCLLLMLCPAWASTAVPSDGVISSAGEYHLTANRTNANTYNIQVTASNVLLDLRGYTVRCNPADVATAVTTGVKINAANVTVRNGKITNCYMGVNAWGSSGNVIEGIDFTDTAYIGVHGGTTIRGNIFRSIGGYTTEAYAIGVNQPGGNCLVTGNIFRDLYRQPGSIHEGEGVGVLLTSASPGCTIEGNWFENEQTDDEGRSLAIWIAVGGSATIRDNAFTNLERAVTNRGVCSVTDNRFWMRDAEASSVAIDGDGVGASTTATGNVIVGFDNGFLGSVTESGNLILP